MGGCTSCGGGRRGNMNTRRSSNGRDIASRSGKLPWLHVTKDAEGNEQSRVPYKTEEQAKSAAQWLGGEVRENK